MENISSTSHTKLPKVTYEVLCQAEVLQRAWQYIRDKGAAGGIDKQSVNEFALGADTYLAEMLTDLKAENCEYILHPFWKGMFYEK